MESKIETKEVRDIEIWDGTKFTPIRTVQRYPKDAYTVTITTENGFSCTMKNTHPSWCMITRNDICESVVQAKHLLDKWVLTEKGYSKVVSVEETEYEGLLYDISTDTKAFEADGIRTHNSFHCFHKDSLVFVLDPKKNIYAYTLEELFDEIEEDLYEDDHKQFKLVPPNYFVWSDGSWTPLLQVTRHVPTEKMLFICEGTNVLMSQETHKLAIHKNLSRCTHCEHPSIKKKKTAKKSTCCKCAKIVDKLPNQFDPVFNLVEGKDVEKGDFARIDKSVMQEVSEGANPKYSGYVVGFFLAEGYVVYTRKRSKKTKEFLPYRAARVEITQLHQHLKEHFLQRLLQEAPDQSKVRVTEEGVQISSVEEATYFSSNFPRYAHNKKLQPNFLQYSATWLYDFLAGLIDSDGYIEYNRHSYRYATISVVSWALIQQIGFILTKLQIPFSITGGDIPKSHVYKGQTITGRYPRFCIKFPLSTDVLKNLNTSYKCVNLDKGINSPAVKESYNKGVKKITVCKPVEYKFSYVYDLTTESGLMSVSSFIVSNSGGIATGRGVQSVSALQRAQQLFNLPKTLPNSAVISKSGGVVSKIEKDPSTNGHYVFVKAEKEEHKHYVPPSRDLLVRTGDSISRGDSLSDGVINPRQLLQHKNMDAVRDYITDQLHKIYKNVGGTRRRNVEVVVRNLTNLTEVADPGKSDHLTGDVVPLNIVQDFNSKARPEDKILHKPILKGIEETALLKDEDYLSRMNFQRIQSTLVEGAGKGWKTTTKNTTNPIPAFAASTIGPQVDKTKPHY